MSDFVHVFRDAILFVMLECPQLSLLEGGHGKSSFNVNA